MATFIGITIFLIVWGGISTLVGLAGKQKRIGFWGAFLATFFLGLLIGLIITLTSKDINESPVKIIRCDGCREIINGQYIVIRPHGLETKYDYCSKACRDKYHGEHMKEQGITWSPPVEIKENKDSKNDSLDADFINT